MMKTISFTVSTDTRVGLQGADEVALCLGPDALPRIAAHIGKSVYFTRAAKAGFEAPVLVARASTDKGPQSLPVVDCYGISVASSFAADVVTGRGRTKGQTDQTFHGPWMTVIPPAGKPGVIQFHGFTEGAVRPVFDSTADSDVELWSKDGSWRVVDVGVGATITSGKDSIGKTGEKLAVAPGRWRAFGGCSTFDNSRVMQRGGKPVDVVDCDKYRGAGDDVYGYVSICVRPAQMPVCYFAAEMLTGWVRINKVKGGKALFPIGSLPGIGACSKMARHPVQLCLVQGRVVAFWTLAGWIYAADVDGCLADASEPVMVCPGEKAAAVTAGSGVALAVIRKGEVRLVQLECKKV